MALLPKRASRRPYRLPDEAPSWVKAVERVATRYASPRSSTPRERTRFHYLRAKLLADPVAKLIADLAVGEPNGFGVVFDVGTGRGQLPLLLIELGAATSASGIDWDRDKIAIAERAATGQTGDLSRVDATFTHGDAHTVSFDAADTVLLVDVLHYFTHEEQDKLLDRAALAVRPGGRILVREADAQRGWRSFMTLAEERFFTFIGFNRAERVRFRPAREIAARLEANGLRCIIRPAWGKTPFSNVLVVGRKV
jgi:SAM-dependent methyltransferase